MTSVVFPARPKSFPGESLRGYLRRLAAAMNVESVRDLDGVLAGCTSRLHLITSEQLSELIGSPSAAIDHMRATKVGKDALSFRGERLPSYFLHLERARVCPVCLVDAPFHRQVWDLAFLHICPVHAVELVERCIECDAKISWDHPGILQCAQCGARIKPKAKTTPYPEAAAVRRVLSWIGGVDGNEAAKDVPTVLQGLPFGPALEFCIAVGRVAFVQSGGELQRGRTFSDKMVGQVLVRGLELADGWPLTFHQMMERHLANLATEGSLTDYVGHMARFAVRGPIEWRKIIHKALVDFLIAHPEVPCKANHEMGKEVLRGRGYCTIKEAQEILAVDQRRFASIRRSSAWQDIVARSDPSGFIPASEVRALASEIQGVLSLAEVGRAIGITDKTHLRLIASSDVFGALPNATHYDQRTKHIPKERVDEFLALIGRLPTKAEADPGLVEFKEAVALASQRGISIARVVDLIASGTLPAACRDSRPGISGVFLHKDRAASLFDRIAAQEMGSISVREAAAELVMLEREAYQLAKLGYLKTEYVRGASNLRGQRIHRRALVEFDRTFVSARKFAWELGADISSIRQLIRKSECGARGRRLHQRIEVYRRGALQAVKDAVIVGLVGANKEHSAAC